MFEIMFKNDLLQLIRRVCQLLGIRPVIVHNCEVKRRLKGRKRMERKQNIVMKRERERDGRMGRRMERGRERETKRTEREGERWTK